MVHVLHSERVGNAHMSHSFVRGNWRNSKTSSPMILAKSCHDMDILLWLAGRRLKRVSSFGSLTHFKPENAPAGAPERCTDGCPAGIPIPDVFAAFNDMKSAKEDVSAQGKAAYAAIEHKADECIGCGQCENACPQFLHIRELLADVAKAF